MLYCRWHARLTAGDGSASSSLGRSGALHPYITLLWGRPRSSNGVQHRTCSKLNGLCCSCFSYVPTLGWIHPVAAAKGLNHPSLLRMRTMMKSAGDKLAADLKNLKVLYHTPTYEGAVVHFVVPFFLPPFAISPIVPCFGVADRSLYHTGERGVAALVKAWDRCCDCFHRHFPLVRL